MQVFVKIKLLYNIRYIKCNILTPNHLYTLLVLV